MLNRTHAPRKIELTKSTHFTNTANQPPWCHWCLEQGYWHLEGWTQVLPSSLSRRSFLLGTTGARMMLGETRHPSADSIKSIPDSFDARDHWKGLIHPIRDQQQCGSCWAFSATEVLADRLAVPPERLPRALCWGYRVLRFRRYGMLWRTASERLEVLDQQGCCDRYLLSVHCRRRKRPELRKQMFGQWELDQIQGKELVRHQRCGEHAEGDHDERTYPSCVQGYKVHVIQIRCVLKKFWELIPKEDMLSRLSDGEPNPELITGWLPTRGTPYGERRDSSRSREVMMSVVWRPWDLPTPVCRLSKSSSSILLLLLSVYFVYSMHHLWSGSSGEWFSFLLPLSFIFFCFVGCCVCLCRRFFKGSI